ARVDVLRAIAKALSDADDDAGFIDTLDDPIRAIAPLRRQLDAQHAERRPGHTRAGCRLRRVGRSRDPYGSIVRCADEPGRTTPDRRHWPTRVLAPIAVVTDGAVVGDGAI